MQIAGVDRLLNLARELGIEPTRKVGGSAAERPSDPIKSSRSDSEAVDIRVSLSSAARALEAKTATPSPAIDATVTSTSEPIESSEMQGTGTKVTNGAIAAYQRNTASPIGERLRVRA
jgi:hypothetical protein